jgi:WD40 repeat protein
MVCADSAPQLAHDNAHYAVGCSGGHVGLWDARTNAPLSAASGAGQGHTSDVSGLSFSPDDRQLVSGGLDGNCFVWNVYGAGQ